MIEVLCLVLVVFEKLIIHYIWSRLDNMEARGLQTLLLTPSASREATAWPLWEPCKKGESAGHSTTPERQGACSPTVWVCVWLTALTLLVGWACASHGDGTHLGMELVGSSS